MNPRVGGQGGRPYGWQKGEGSTGFRRPCLAPPVMSSEVIGSTLFYFCVGMGFLEANNSNSVANPEKLNGRKSLLNTPNT